MATSSTLSSATSPAADCCCMLTLSDYVLRQPVFRSGGAIFDMVDLWIAHGPFLLPVW